MKQGDQVWTGSPPTPGDVLSINVRRKGGAVYACEEVFTDERDAIEAYNAEPQEFETHMFSLFREITDAGFKVTVGTARGEIIIAVEKIK